MDRDSLQPDLEFLQLLKLGPESPELPQPAEEIPPEYPELPQPAEEFPPESPQLPRPVEEFPPQELMRLEQLHQVVHRHQESLQLLRL